MYNLNRLRTLLEFRIMNTNLKINKMETLKIKKEFITPDIAKKYLESNSHNRRISKPSLMRYVGDMLKGNWREDTGELIKISKKGRILDGQHRLEAIVKSKCSLYFHVAYDIDESVFDVLDTGKSRNATDCFMSAGVKYDNSIPSIISLYNSLEDGRKRGMQINFKATNAELLQQYYENEIFWQNVAKKSHNWYLSFAKIITPSIIGGFFAHFYNLNPEKSELFMNQLTTGLNVDNQIINLLRNKLMQDKMSQRKMPINLKLALIIKTWNYYIKGVHAKILKFDYFRDEFPIAIKP